MKVGILRFALTFAICLVVACADEPPSGPLPSCALRVVDWGEADSSFKLISMDPPLYPDIAREHGQQGTVLIRAIIDHDGLACETEVHESSGYSLLDSSALAAAETVKFSIARSNGLPVRVEVFIPLEYSLRG